MNPQSGALGKYQVMPSNVASWTKRALGFSLTPAEFLASPAAQEKTVQNVLGGYFRKDEDVNDIAIAVAQRVIAWLVPPRPATHTRFPPR